MKIHDPTAVPLECPFQAALTVQKGEDGRPVPTFVRAPCGDYCAGYDRAGARSCFEAARAVGEMPKVPLRAVSLPPAHATAREDGYKPSGNGLVRP